ncbi:MULTISPECIES: MarR family winged helix-turn-helix transcriptional regulator [unclassified Endozoicomonas]|uniref:MarR family winged helix-turn-helix transcriptional regulator n=1 Tax=unclassified Endozoicomonas TaxID=2644528 RepID=UPI003BB731C3
MARSSRNRQPYGGIEPCFNLRLRQANRVLTSHYDDYLRDLGLTIAQFSILRSLWYMKSTAQKDLQAVLVLQQTTLTRNLKLLQKAGYIQTTQGEADRRISMVSLTEEGKNIFKQARTRWKEAQQDVSRRLGDKNSQQLIQVAEAIMAM